MSQWRVGMTFIRDDTLAIPYKAPTAMQAAQACKHASSRIQSDGISDGVSPFNA
jgi:hypothetical protein